MGGLTDADYPVSSTGRPAGAPPAEIVQLEPDHWTKPFWDAAKSHTLVAQCCADCRTFRMPPTPFCSCCRSQRVEWIQLSGRARVYTHTVIRHPAVPALEEHVPYVLALVEFDDAPGIRLLTNIVECDPRSRRRWSAGRGRVGRRVAGRDGAEVSPRITDSVNGSSDPFPAGSAGKGSGVVSRRPAWES